MTIGAGDQVLASAGPVDIAAVAAAANAEVLSLGNGGGEATKPGRYVFGLDKPATLAVELVGGGGGGGGTSAGDQTMRGDGGRAAIGVYLRPADHFDAGVYLLVVGSGGSGGSGGGWSAPPVDGHDGEPTTIGLWPNGFPTRVGMPGAGGKGNAVPMHHQGNDDYAGNGDDRLDPLLGTIHHGGAGGGWQKGGGDGNGYGSGGGGQGGTTHPGQSSGGKGGNGYARVSRVGGNEG